MFCCRFDGCSPNSVSASSALLGSKHVIGLLKNISPAEGCPVSIGVALRFRRVSCKSPLLLIVFLMIGFDVFDMPLNETVTLLVSW